MTAIPHPITSAQISAQQDAKPLRKFGSRAPASPATRPDWPKPVRIKVAKLTRLTVPADLDPCPTEWSAADRLAFEQKWSGDWPCPHCGEIGCDHDEDLPAYRGAFDTEGRH